MTFFSNKKLQQNKKAAKTHQKKFDEVIGRRSIILFRLIVYYFIKLLSINLSPYNSLIPDFRYCLE